jgi:hypothetical protein
MLSMRTLARTQTFLWPFPLQNDLRSLTIDCQLELNLSQLPLDGRRGFPSAQYALTVPVDVLLGGPCQVFAPVPMELERPGSTAAPECFTYKPLTAHGEIHIFELLPGEGKRYILMSTDSCPVG